MKVHILVVIEHDVANERMSVAINIMVLDQLRGKALKSVMFASVLPHCLGIVGDNQQPVVAAFEAEIAKLLRVQPPLFKLIKLGKEFRIE